MTSRRTFLQRSSLATPLLFVQPFRILVDAGTSPAEATAFGLFTHANDLDRLRQLFATEPRFATLRQELETIDFAAERQFVAEEIRYNDQLVHLARISNVAQSAAFQYLMTERQDAAALSAEMVREIMKFERWDYFLEGGDRVFGLQRAPGATLAVALASDWLGDTVAMDERAAWLRRMGERGLEASHLALYGMRYPDRVEGWTMDETSTFFEHRPGDRFDLSNWPRILDKTNLKAIPASALAIGTVAYQKQFGADADTERWLEQAIFSISSFRDMYARDGSYDEGVSYAQYTSAHLAQATAVLQRHLGVDLYDVINWPGYVEYLREMSMPTAANPGAIVNFGDAGGGSTSAVPYWVAARSFDGASQWFGSEMAAAHDEWSLFWFDPSIDVEAPDPRPHIWRSDLDWLVARTGYGTDDLVVAMRSGDPSNHEHADRNSLIVKWLGEQLVADPHRPPYGYSDPSWMMRTTAGHSALLIDGEGHQYHDGSEGTNASDAAARIVRTAEREGYLSWTSDATPAYRLVNEDVESVTRTVVVLYEVPAVIVLDKVIKTATPSRLQARFFGYNLDNEGRISAQDDYFNTRRPLASLLGRGYSALGVAARADHLPIPEETARLHPFAEIGTTEAVLTPFLATVLVAEPGSGGSAVAEVHQARDGAFEIRCVSEGREAVCTVRDTGRVPEVHVTTTPG